MLEGIRPARVAIASIRRSRTTTVAPATGPAPVPSISVPPFSTFMSALLSIFRRPLSNVTPERRGDKHLCRGHSGTAPRPSHSTPNQTTFVSNLFFHILVLRCIQMIQSQHNRLAGLVPGIHGNRQGLCCGSWVPTDQVRGLKAHGPSPATTIE